MHLDLYAYNNKFPIRVVLDTCLETNVRTIYKANLIGGLFSLGNELHGQGVAYT